MARQRVTGLVLTAPVHPGGPTTPCEPNRNIIDAFQAGHSVAEVADLLHYSAGDVEGHLRAATSGEPTDFESQLEEKDTELSELADAHAQLHTEAIALAHALEACVSTLDAVHAATTAASGGELLSAEQASALSEHYETLRAKREVLTPNGLSAAVGEESGTFYLDDINLRLRGGK